MYFVVSQRPVHIELNVDSPRAPCRIATGDERHLDDLREYLDVACARPEIAAALRHAGVAKEVLIAALTEKSGGVWLYVHYALKEIENGQRDLEHLDDLPAGLWSFYAQQCNTTREADPERWEHYDLPILGSLGIDVVRFRASGHGTG